MGGHVAYEVRKGLRIVVGKSEVMSPCGKPWCGWKDYITTYIAEWENMDVVHDSY